MSMSNLDLMQALRGRIAQLEGELTDYQNMVCMMVSKFGNPVIITERDIREMPSQGGLTVTTDAETGSIMITFAQILQTSEDMETNEPKNPQGDVGVEGNNE